MDKERGHLQSVWHTSLFICFATLLFTYSLLSFPFYFFSFLLQITPESENDFGSYNCTASNEMGTESKEFLLIQAGQWWYSDPKSLHLHVYVCVFSMIQIWGSIDDRSVLRRIYIFSSCLMPCVLWINI